MGLPRFVRSSLLATSFVLAVATPAAAQVPFGTVAAIDGVELLPDRASATRVRLSGTFLTWTPAGYDAGTRGSLELVCPPGREAECREQWTTLGLARCVQFGWDSAPAVVSAPTPQTWSVLRGVEVLGLDHPLCMRARAVPRAPAPSSVAPEDAPVSSSPARTERRFYGWYIIASDTVSLVTASTGFGIATFLVVPPFVHVFHGNYGRAALSLGMRATLPPLGALAFCGITSGCQGGLTDPSLAMVAGAMLGATLAAGVDASLSWQEPASETPRKPPSVLGVSALLPTVGFDRSRLTLGIAGAF